VVGLAAAIFPGVAVRLAVGDGSPRSSPTSDVGNVSPSLPPESWPIMIPSATLPTMARMVIIVAVRFTRIVLPKS
jgi:hypothetical protein